MISALDDIVEDFSLYLRVEKRISEGVARNYCYSVKRFVKWADTLNPEKKDAVKYYDALLKEKKKASTIGNILYALKHYYTFMCTLLKILQVREYTPLLIKSGTLLQRLQTTYGFYLPQMWHCTT